MALAASLTVAGCSGLPGFGSDDPPAVAGSPATAPSAATPSPAASSVAPTKSAKPARSDLRKGALKRTFRVSGLVVSVEYSSPLPADRWTPAINKPLNVSLTAYTNTSPGQKIYLTRVRAALSVSDNSGPLDAPDALVDTAPISPGFIVTFPYAYGQVLVLPGVDEGATSITVDFTYEFLLQVTPNSKDYAKQTGRDSLTFALPG